MASNTYAAVGNKEDISDIITMIAREETPVFSRMGRTKAIATHHEWLEDDLGAGASNAQPEGFTYFTVAVPPRVRLENVTQIMSRGIYVTKTQEVVGKHGLTSEIAYQMQKEMKALAFDCELAILTQSAIVAGSMTPPVPREFGGVPYWIVTHVLNNGGAPRPLTFNDINTALQDTWSDGGKPRTLVVSPTNKRVISTFTAGNTKYIEGNRTHALQHYIDVLETDFGRVECVTDIYMPNNTVYGLSMEHIKKAFLRPFKIGNMPEIADLERRFVVGEWTLEFRAEKTHFAITDLDGLVPTV